MNKKTDSFPRITEEELNNLKSRIGVKISRDPEPWCFEATRETSGIMHMVLVMIIHFGVSRIMQQKHSTIRLLLYPPFFFQQVE